MGAELQQLQTGCKTWWQTLCAFLAEALLPAWQTCGIRLCDGLAMCR